MVEVLALALGAVGATCLAALVSARTGLPSPVLLSVVGLVYALLPGPNLSLDPQVILFLVIPPLLYSAALNASLLDIRAHIQAVILLSVVLVLVTALVVGSVAAVVVPGLPLAAGIAFGAIVSPPDAVAVISIGRRVGLPPRLLTVIEGEGLINDATALTTYLVAVGAVGGGFSVTDAVWQFVVAAAGGAATGLLVAWLVGLVRRRLDEPLIESAVSLATPFLAYLPAEELHTSGVLAVVVAGLILGHQSPRLASGPTRLQSRAVWRLVDFLLEGMVFLLIGQQLPDLLDGLHGYSTATVTWAAIAVTAAAVLVRPAWIFPSSLLARRLPPQWRTDPSPSWRHLAVLSWAGTRGVISLAAAFAIPRTVDGEAFPARELVLFLTLVVVLVTLLGQGVTLAPLVRRLGIGVDRQAELEQQAAARHAAIAAGLRRLDELVEVEPPPPGVADRLIENARLRQNAGWERLGNQPGTGGDLTPSAALARLRNEMIIAEREELLRWRDARRLNDASMRVIERELDFEESNLPE